MVENKNKGRKGKQRKRKGRKIGCNGKGKDGGWGRELKGKEGNTGERQKGRREGRMDVDVALE